MLTLASAGSRRMEAVLRFCNAAPVKSMAEPRSVSTPAPVFKLTVDDKRITPSVRMLAPAFIWKAVLISTLPLADSVPPSTFLPEV